MGSCRDPYLILGLDILLALASIQFLCHAKVSLLLKMQEIAGISNGVGRTTQDTINSKKAENFRKVFQLGTNASGMICRGFKGPYHTQRVLGTDECNKCVPLLKGRLF